MIKIEDTEVMGWEPALRGMRNSFESYDKADSTFEDVFEDYENLRTYYAKGCDIGPNDLELALKLAKAGGSHAKYRRMIVVYADVTAPLYLWKELDTYKVGTVANSTSTMHSIHKKEFTLDDFSHEHLTTFEDMPPVTLASTEVYDYNYLSILQYIIRALNVARSHYLETKDKGWWWQMIQLLPNSYNQRRTVMLNYEVLSAMYRDRRNHRLDEWRDFCVWIETLPYSELITCGTKKGEYHEEDTNII